MKLAVLLRWMLVPLIFLLLWYATWIIYPLARWGGTNTLNYVDFIGTFAFMILIQRLSAKLGLGNNHKKMTYEQVLAEYERTHPPSKLNYPAELRAKIDNVISALQDIKADLEKPS